MKFMEKIKKNYWGNKGVYKTSAEKEVSTLIEKNVKIHALYFSD